MSIFLEERRPGDQEKDKNSYWTFALKLVKVERKIGEKREEPTGGEDRELFLSVLSSWEEA